MVVAGWNQLACLLLVIEVGLESVLRGKTFPEMK